MRTYGTITYEPGTNGGPPTWWIAADPDVMIRLKRIFPRVFANRAGAIQVSATPEVCRDIEWVMDRWPFDMDNVAAVALARGSDQHKDLATAVNRIFDGEPIDHDGMRTPARSDRWEHQTRNADLISTVKRLLITDDLGAGKTHSGLLTFRNPDALPALVVVQAHLAEQWRDQTAMTWPDLKSHIIAKGKPYEQDDKRWKACTDADVLIITYAKLAGWMHEFAGQIRSVVFDEVQELRNGAEGPNAPQKGVAAGAIADRANYVVGLTNTPVFNYGDDMHNIMSIIRPDVLGTRPEFLREWCGSSYSNKSIVTDPAALGAFLRSSGAMVTAKIPGEKPVIIPHVVASDPKVFDSMAGDAAEMARFILSGAGTQLERMQAGSDLDWRLRQATGLAKAPYVATFTQMLLEQVDKVVLWGWHRAVYDIWMEKLKQHRPVMYTGSESPSQKRAALEKFQTPNDKGGAQVFVMSLRSGSGLNGLEEVCHVGVLGELDWSPAVPHQCFGRLGRPGQKHYPVLGYVLISDEGADPPMMDTLGIKRNQAEPLIDPDAATIAPVQDTQRIKNLAQYVVDRYGR